MAYLQVSLGFQSQDGRRRFRRTVDGMQQAGLVKQVVGTFQDKGTSALQLLKHPVRRDHLSLVAAADGLSHEPDEPTNIPEPATQIETNLDDQLLNMVAQSGKGFT